LFVQPPSPSPSGGRVRLARSVRNGLARGRATRGRVDAVDKQTKLVVRRSGRAAADLGMAVSQ
jgi:hypothetical protein